MLNIAVVGLGLIGGSIAGALKKSNKYKEINTKWTAQTAPALRSSLRSKTA